MHKRFAKINCGVAAALLSALLALLGVLAHRLVTLARQHKHWTKRRVRLTGIHAVLLLIQVTAIPRHGCFRHNLRPEAPNARCTTELTHAVGAEFLKLALQVPSNVLYLAVNAWTLAGHCRLHGALIDWFRCRRTICSKRVACTHDVVRHRLMSALCRSFVAWSTLGSTAAVLLVLASCAWPAPCATLPDRVQDPDPNPDPYQIFNPNPNRNRDTNPKPDLTPTLTLVLTSALAETLIATLAIALPRVLPVARRD